MLNYELIEGGYRVFSDDGLINVRQDCVPGIEGIVPMAPDEARAAAEAFIAAYAAQAPAPAEGA